MLRTDAFDDTYIHTYIPTGCGFWLSQDSTCMSCLFVCLFACLLFVVFVTVLLNPNPTLTDFWRHIFNILNI